IQPSIIKDIEAVIRILREEGEMTILLVEQYFEFAQRLADRYVVLNRGEIVAQGTAESLVDDDVRSHLTV
ncbi:MAG TPA: ABC transporter ATP-binding protein, partial [Alphaproteobacteria bacterium]|nr:ABC transporter ATP-binding protein [Alphaproteobacteria bacterium]HJN22052.1 ABC transporter ATP-binding protein [Alphaproteobacteria bacterium]